MFIISLLIFFSSPTLLQAKGGMCQDRIDKDVPPTEIWIEVNRYWLEYPNHPGRSFGHPTPFSLDEYVSGVLLGELGPGVGAITNANLPSEDGLWHQEAITALAVAIRTFTWFRLNYAGQFVDPHTITLDDINQCGFWDEKFENGRQINAQVFRPYADNVSQETKDHYTTIVTQHVPGIYLVEGEGTNPIDAQYRATVGEYSDPGGRPYLISIFDPISARDPDPDNASGLGQWSAQRLAMGLNDAGDIFPKWVSYTQILFHFYTGVNLRVADGNLLPPLPTVDRFNLLQISGQPTYFRPGKTYQVPEVVLQNTGPNDWVVTQLSDASQSCTNSPTNLSYHLYQPDLVDLACGDQLPDEGENPSGVSCFEGYRNPLCLVNQAVINPGQHLALNDVSVFIPPTTDLHPGGYWLRWDMEFLHPNDSLPPTWGSRLHLPPYTGEWFTQDKWVIIGKANYSEVKNLTSPSHQTSAWETIQSLV